MAMAATLFDPMDPVDLCILMDPNCEDIVREAEEAFKAEVDSFDRISMSDIDVHQGVYDNDFDYTEGFPPGEDFSDAGDIASDIVASDAADYEDAEMDLLSGSIASKDPISAIDSIEFGGM